MAVDASPHRTRNPSAISTCPAKYALPVVVAPPEMVRPVVCVPPPIVEEAETKIPRVVVGARAPFTTCQSRKASLKKPSDEVAAHDGRPVE